MKHSFKIDHVNDRIKKAPFDKLTFFVDKHMSFVSKVDHGSAAN